MEGLKMLGQNLDIKGVYIGKLKEIKETILLNDFKSNKNTMEELYE
ncbi:hypothetical protein [Clostridium perfringens]|nr:hypothetical protein [Clostridium perfringens]